MAQQPALDQRRLMRAVVVQDQVDLKVLWNLGIDAVQELAKLRRAVSAMQFPNDLAAGHVQCSEQRGGAVTLVVVRAPLGLARTQRQNRLGAIERLDLALLVSAQHQYPFRRVQIQADDVTHLLDQLRISRQLERLRSMWLQAKCFPDAVDSRA